jgi:hypothetical protein
MRASASPRRGSAVSLRLRAGCAFGAVPHRGVGPGAAPVQSCRCRSSAAGYLADHIPGTSFVEVAGGDAWFFTKAAGEVLDEHGTGEPEHGGKVGKTPTTSGRVCSMNEERPSGEEAIDTQDQCTRPGDASRMTQSFQQAASTTRDRP